MQTGRFALPVALASVTVAILLTDLTGPIPDAALAMTTTAGAALACLRAAGVRGRFGAALLLAGVVLMAGALGSWRQSGSAAPAAGRVPVAWLVDGAEHLLVGTVIDDPRPRGDRLQMVLGDVMTADGGGVPLAERLLVWLPRGMAIQTGDQLRLTTRVELPENFDGFAYREYLARQGIGGIGRTSNAVVVGRSEGAQVALAGVRAVLLDGLNRSVPEPEAALGAGILLGVRAAIAPEINDAFERAGLTHVVAISGWNIAIVAALVAAAARPLARRRGGRHAGALIAVATVAGYVLLTGATPSVVRAALMAGALLVARLGGSRAHAASALGLAALVMLIAAPSLLWDVGFQLSLLATGGLIWFGAPIERRMTAWPALIREPVALTLAAQITTLPVILINFERLSLIAPVANVLVVPFVPLAMLFSAIASIVSVLAQLVPVPFVADAAVWLTGGAAWLVLRAMVLIGSALASVPYASVEVKVPAALAVAWLPVVALATWAIGSGTATPEPGAQRTRGQTTRLTRLARSVIRPLPVSAALVATLGVIALSSMPDGRLHLTALDVGQGDAILVETPTGATMLVDGGPDPELTLRRLGANLPYFERRIDLMVVSHPHQDHVAGLVDVLNRFKVGSLMHAGIDFENPSYDQLLTDAAAAGTTVTFARTGQVARLDATTTVEVLYPAEADAAAALPEGDINNGSIVLVLRHGAFDALLTGDAEAPTETLLLGRGLIHEVDVLKVGHHGSTSSTTPALLEAARPRVAIISAGVDNEYGHPAAPTLDILGGVPGLTVHRTDLEGDVEIISDGTSYRVSTATIAPCPFPTAPPRGASWTMPNCPMASWSTPRALPASPWRPRGSWRRHRSRSTEDWWRQRHCSTTSTSSRSDVRAGSTGSWGRGAWRPRATLSLPCRSPPTRSPASSTTIASRAAGRRSSWRCRIGTSRRSS